MVPVARLVENLAAKVAVRGGLMNRANWVWTVDRLLRREWCLSVADAGIDDEQLTRAWREGEDPAAFVAWFAEKYDLIRFEPRPFRSAPSKPQPPA